MCDNEALCHRLAALRQTLHHRGEAWLLHHVQHSGLIAGEGASVRCPLRDDADGVSRSVEDLDDLLRQAVEGQVRELRLQADCIFLARIDLHRFGLDALDDVLQRDARRHQRLGDDYLALSIFSLL